MLSLQLMGFEHSIKLGFFPKWSISSLICNIVNKADMHQLQGKFLLLLQCDTGFSYALAPEYFLQLMHVSLGCTIHAVSFQPLHGAVQVLASIVPEKSLDEAAAERDMQQAAVDAQALLFCERFVEFLTDLLSQLPTRRFLRTLLEDRAILVKCRMSPLFQHPQGLTLSVTSCCL